MTESDLISTEEALVDRVAALDIAKASAVVCVREPHTAMPGRRVQDVWGVAATTNAIIQLADQLTDRGVTRVVMEATGAYWRPFFFLIEARGLDCWLVNARDVKNVPGRPKTDKLDAVWLAKLTERGMLRASFVPPRPIRQLRDLTRMRTVLMQERSRHKQRVEKILEDAQIKLSSVATDMFGVSGRAMLEAMIAGQRDPRALAAMAKGRMVSKTDKLVEALTGQFTDHHAFLCQTLLDSIDHLTAQIDGLTARITAAIEHLPGTSVQQNGSAGTHMVNQIDAIPGVGTGTAQVLLAELGMDMSVFPTADHLASWAKLTPRTIQSGPKISNGKTGKGNPWLKGALGEAALSAARSKTFLGARYQRIVKRRGRKKALVAIARSILAIVWNLISDPTKSFFELGADYHTRRLDPQKRTRDLVRQLNALGHNVALTPA